MPNNAVDPVDAVLSILDEPVGAFWHGVLSSYVLGQYYNSQVNFKLLDQDHNYSITVIIDTTGTNSTHNLKADYSDLSGTLVKVKPGDLSMVTKAPMSFTVDDPTNCGILVCKYKQGSEITEIGNVFPGGSGEVIISDVKPIFDAGYELVVMVSNSKHDKTRNYNGANRVELVIELNKSEISMFAVGLHFDEADFTVTYNNGDPQTYIHEDDYNMALTTEYGEISIDGNVFSAIFDNVHCFQSTRNGTMSFTLLENPRRLNVNVDITIIPDGIDDTHYYVIDYNDLPFTSNETWNGEVGDHYFESGSAVCRVNHIYRVVTDWFTSEITGYSCDGNDSQILVDGYYKESE